MIAVYYSLVAGADGTRERQWARSVQSLRRFNSDVCVVLCLYGGAQPETIAAANRANVHVQQMGEFSHAFGDVPAYWRHALSRIPTLHKLLSLRALVSNNLVTRLIYLDCDTYLFGDIADLAAWYNRCDWYAREEHWAVPGFDEIARREGLVLVPPHNTGVILLTAELARTLATLLDDFVWYTWRLLLGSCLWCPELVRDRALREFVQERAGAGERALALPYPGNKFWIIEEIATSLTLGRVPGLSHCLLRRADVAHGDECTRRAPGTILVHYFTSREQKFMASLEGEHARDR
jgi:hypothetical protein